LSPLTDKEAQKDSSKESVGDREGRPIREFWQRITAGLELQELWTQFKEETREGYRVSSREVNWQEIKKIRNPERFLVATREIIAALFMKLTPARRVFLLIALVFALLSLAQDGTFGLNDATWTFLAAASLLLLLALELADRVSMKRDLEIARDIQSWLVPAVPPSIDQVDIAFTTRPANTVAGDYYDAFLRETNTDAAGSSRLFLVVADVAGKSVPAAMLMATFQASLRTLAASPISLAELTRRLNHYACAHSLNGRRFTTGFMAELDLEGSSLTYVTAGHNAPVLRRSTGEIERLEAGGVPLGVQDDWSYELGTTTLGPDDLLVAFSDGVSEAVNEANEEYGESRLVELVRMAPKEDAASSLGRVIGSVDTFVGDTRQNDDITCLVLRRQ
jgi:serine phosphatase RsbU (regulator of sigma subunit)